MFCGKILYSKLVKQRSRMSGFWQSRENTNYMKRNIKIFFIGFLILLIYSVVLQIKVENYIKVQRKEYKIIFNKERINYIPYVMFVLKDNFQNNTHYLSHNYFFPYEEINITKFNSNKDYDKYLVYCYYSKKELMIGNK